MRPSGLVHYISYIAYLDKGWRMRMHPSHLNSIPTSNSLLSHRPTTMVPEPDERAFRRASQSACVKYNEILQAAV